MSVARRSLTRITLAPLLVACVLSASCGSDAAPAAAGMARADATSARQEPRVVTLTPAVKREVARTVVVSGTLAADDRVILSSRVPGRLASIAVDLGTPVQTGQVIAQIEPDDYRLRVEQAKSALGQARASLGLPPEGDDAGFDAEQTSTVRQARATLEETRASAARGRQLLDRKLIAQADFDAVNTAFLRAEAALESAREEVRTRQAFVRQRRTELALAQKDLADTSIRSPMDGVVQLKSASVGEYLQPAAPIATVVRIHPLRMRVAVPERDAASIGVGQPVIVHVEGDARDYQGQVARVAPALDEQNRTLIVEAEVPNPGTLKPGSFARAEVKTSTEQVLTVPSSAIVVFAGIEKVLTIVEGKAFEKRVTTGRASEGYTEVLSGLEQGELVIAKPGNLQQGAPVTPAEK